MGSIQLIFLLLIHSLISSSFGWQQLFPSGVVPVARMGHTTLVYNDTVLLSFGGRTSVFGSVNDSVSFIGSNCTAIGGCNEGINAGACVNLTETLNRTATASTGDLGCQCNTGYNGTNCELTFISQWLNEVLFYNIQTNRWSTQNADSTGVLVPVAWPSARYHHSAVMINQSMLIYAGYSQLCGDYCSDVWMFTPSWRDSKGRGRWIQLNTSMSVTDAGKRWQHSAVAFNNTMYIFGGHRHGSFLNDLWRLDHATGRYYNWVEITSVSSMLPAPRLGHASAIDVARNLMYIYGGLNPTPSDQNDEHFLGDFWTFDLVSLEWTQILAKGDATDAPSFLMGARAAMSDFMLFLFDGYFDNNYDSRIWRYNSTSGFWTQHQIPITILSLPAERNYQSLVFMPQISSFFMFGGWGSASSDGVTLAETYYNDLWQLDLNVCPDDCNHRGTCSYGYCFCAPGYFGVDCQNQQCLSSHCFYSGLTLLQVCTHCAGHGDCKQGACMCSEGFITVNETEACTVPFCPRQCSGHGTCASDGNGGNACQCSAGFYGRDCSLGYCSSNCNSPFGACNTTSATCTCATAPMGRYSGDTCSRFITTSAATSLAMGWVVPVIVLWLVALLSD